MVQENIGRETSESRETNLDGRYRDIGISAVAAALRYTAAPAGNTQHRIVAASGIDPRFIEAAA